MKCETGFSKPCCLSNFSTCRHYGKDGSMEHLACFVPGMLVLGADDTSPENERGYLDIAKRVVGGGHAR